jgi:hypothetical protein
MTLQSTKNLMALACATSLATSDEFGSLHLVLDKKEKSTFSELLKSSMEQIAAEKKDAAVQAAVKDVLQLMEEADKTKAELIEEIRAARAKAANILKRIKDIEAATLYGAKTDNYLPLAAAMYNNIESPKGMSIEDYHKLVRIPEEKKVSSKTVVVKRN